ncbi:uncharacterized protein MKK02DRAFT_43693 [Dioszegia hungarica]|uniref:Transmembrane protein n=1 Tax=Dioszegia hungarica TaxID=4972 RepID=A0AA38H734_9TREE|nr:uncharacterized protein MKK02DRAFT_43693 [Dioszegia hungarica]KAI9635017.1 hypothetical protein MKK02DRAFT_43693 [Dioszegia hungarica]
MRSIWRFLALFAFLACLLPAVSASIFSEPALSYCKCICFSNSTIIPLFRPSDPSKPCLSCTKQFCLDQKLAICKNAELPELDVDVGTGTEGDVEARCFKRDSPRDELIVTFFVLTVIGMLLFAAVRGRFQKAIETRGRPTDLRQWTHVLLPEQLQPLSDNLLAKVGAGRAQQFDGREMQDTGRSGSYAPIT